MRMLTKVFAAAATLTFAANTAVADGHLARAVDARQAVMNLRAFELGRLGAMAKGAVEYNAEAATIAANNLKALSSLNQMAMWPEGSDNSSMGDKTRALPKIWTEFPQVAEADDALSAAVDTLAADAGKDLAALQAAVGGVGKTCGVCHELFRADKK